MQESLIFYGHHQYAFSTSLKQVETDIYCDKVDEANWHATSCSNNSDVFYTILSSGNACTTPRPN